jgi:DNA-binding NarL/FixJ family response regulator
MTPTAADAAVHLESQGRNDLARAVYLLLAENARLRPNASSTPAQADRPRQRGNAVRTARPLGFRERAREMCRAGQGKESIAADLGVSLRTVQRWTRNTRREVRNVIPGVV